ncbi:hypothetical protein [Kutzneria buriramensis]|uniref:Uncharacterized protein n=1 Tax=Kutzneria buriramensis TaxID=1045776 RepID=A0A3E0HFN8_9PSEU|nr:hypothetical protein [Kutzneria buriramensis]REH44615.1 hypothetical protein BCF44_10895 [Kutzneria buriramensis]
MPHRKPRRLGIATDYYRWHVGHAHEPLEDALERDKTCREILVIRREGCQGRLHVTFAVGNGNLVRDGWLVHAGAVRHADGRGLNLNQPGVVRAFLDQAIATGWDPFANRTTELDGWALFDTAHAVVRPA